jgi:hypothetical protein
MRLSMKNLIFFFIGVIFIINTSCDSSQIKRSSLPNVSGGAGEILVVIDKAKWESPLGDTLRSIFSEAMPQSLETEPYFKLIQISETGLSDLFKKHRNILYIILNDKKSTNYGFKEDVWASPQIIGYLNAPSIDSMIHLLVREGKTIRQKYIYKEIDRWRNIFNKTYDFKKVEELKEKQHYWVNVPKGFSLDVNKPGFIWISSENRDITMGIIGWYYPYKSKEQLQTSELIKKRDEVVKINVPGPVENSYMKTEMLFEPTTQEFVYKGRYFLRMEGLWKLENAFMGGPFVSITTVDDKNKRIISVEGFVFAPRKEKRNILRQLEGILYTLSIE